MSWRYFRMGNAIYRGTTFASQRRTGDHWGISVYPLSDMIIYREFTEVTKEEAFLEML